MSIPRCRITCIIKKGGEGGSTVDHDMYIFDTALQMKHCRGHGGRERGIDGGGMEGGGMEGGGHGGRGHPTT